MSVMVLRLVHEVTNRFVLYTWWRISVRVLDVAHVAPGYLMAAALSEESPIDSNKFKVFSRMHQLSSTCQHYQVCTPDRGVRGARRCPRFVCLFSRFCFQNAGGLAFIAFQVYNCR